MSTDPVTQKPDEGGNPGGDQPATPTVTTTLATPTIPDDPSETPDNENAGEGENEGGVEDSKEEKPGVVQVDEEARRAGLTRLATIFSVAFIVALAAMMLAKFVKMP
jgi:hypothetical protein